MSRQVNLYEAKTNLSRLVDEAARGEEIVIAKNGKAKARLVPIADSKPKTRVGGQWARFLTPEEKKDWGSAEWWRRWKEADVEIERNFEQGLEEDWKEFDSKWPNTSSTPTPSSTSKSSRKSSARKPGKRSKTAKTDSA
jgi:prevent-host-death family protein